MIITVGEALQFEAETAQQRWLSASSMSEKVTAIIGTEMRGVSPEALEEMSSSLKTMVAKMEGGLRTVNQLGESWPVDSIEV